MLVDLTGHTGGARMQVFAHRAAPVQVTWIGYPNTTGLREMDYRMVDLITDPLGADTFHTEKLIRLPHGFLCYSLPPDTTDLPLSMPPSTANGQITFGSFNNLAKISPQAVALWASIMCAVPTSRLILKTFSAADIKVWDHLIDRLVEAGVDSGRVVPLMTTRSQRDHFSLYHMMDIALDTFPYNGTTTTVEALYMGVPVITLAGDRHASRVGASLLNRVGLPELVAKTPEEYVQIAVDLASDSDRLFFLRSTMRKRFEQSPLRDEEHFTYTVEQTFRKMWEIYCAGEKPRAFDVTSDKSYSFSNLKPVPLEMQPPTPPPPSSPMPEIKTRKCSPSISHKTSKSAYCLMSA